MRYIVFTFFQLCYIASFAQHSPTALGGTVSGSDLEISFAIGEVFIANSTQTELSIHSGVIQPFTNLSVDIKEISVYDLKIYPNPTNSNLKIEQVESLFSKYEIYTITGKLLIQGQFENQIDGLEKLPSGIYLLRLRNEKQVYNSLFEKI